MLDREQASAWIEASEQPMLVAAALAVAIYLMDLAGIWELWGLVQPYQALALLIDVLFVADLGAKSVVQRSAYWRSPWFLIDLLCTLPILSTLALAPGVLQSMRLMRALRVLRALRMLRVLRTLRILRLLSDPGQTPEQRRWHLALGSAVLVYAACFVALVTYARTHAPHGELVSIEGVEVHDRVQVEIRKDDGTVVTRELPPDQLFSDANRVELLLVLGALLGLALMLVVARFQIPAIFSRQLRALLNVALPEQVAEWMINNPEAYDKTVRMPATVVFCDIKGFTSTVEQLELAELKRHLERALEVVVEAHRAQDLIIDKFIGDAVMSFRGGDIAGGEPDEIAWRVVRGAVDGIHALRELDDPHFRDIKVGGASSDNMLIGAFGTSARLSYTVLGDKVNLAARLEGACNSVGVSNLFDDATRELCRGRDDLVWRRVGMVAVQGRQGVAMAWEAYDQADDTEWIADYESALVDVENREFERAMDKFGTLLQRREDGPSQRWLDACRVWARGVDASWQPVIETRK